MPPKKVEEPERKPLIGRVGTNLKVGIVGVPNVGKSTFFNVLTKSQAAAENFPFCTIDPNENNVLIMELFEHYKNNVDNVNVEAAYPNKKVIINSSLDHIKKSQEVSFSYSLPLSAAVIGLNNSSIPLTEKSSHANLWTDLDVQSEYLRCKPICYLILGKPGIGAYSLGEAISKKLSCIHLCPEKMISDELEQRNTTGQCIDFNLRHHKILKVNHILDILKKKTYSPSVIHRGYVISGLPLITSKKDVHYYFQTLYTEESLTIVKDIFDEIFSKLNQKRKRKVASRSGSSQKVTEEEEEMFEEEQELEVDEQDSVEDDSFTVSKFILNSCTDVIFKSSPIMVSKLSVILDQLDYLFDLDTKPDVIIYLTCHDEDALTKRSHKFYNYDKNSHINIPFYSNLPATQHWPAPYKSDLFNETIHDELRFENTKYNCKQPINLKKNSIDQLCNYKHYVDSYIEKKIKNYDPKYVIKLNACFSTKVLVEHVLERLRLIPVNPIIIPKPLFLLGDAIPENAEDLWSFIDNLHLGVSGNISFSRHPSLWFNRCPVQLKYGKTVTGDPKYAASFMKHIYLLSSRQSLDLFCANPRPFLKMEYLQPTCRVIVIGTRNSGKTMISECLSYIFDAPILCYNTVLEHQRQNKFERYTNNILSELLNTIENNRQKTWESLELDRLAKLEQWVNEIHRHIKEYVNLSKKVPVNEKKLHEIRSTKLGNIPFLDDIAKCTEVLLDRNLLFEYAPSDLVKFTKHPVKPVQGDEDVVQAIDAYIIANNLQTEIQPSPEELVLDILKFCTSIDEKVQQSSNFERQYGNWIIDGFPSSTDFWTVLSELKMLPDYTIALLENREINTELMHNYRKVKRAHKNYRERIPLINDPLIKIKGSTKTIDIPTVLEDVHGVVHDIINNVLQAIEYKFLKIEEEINDFSASVDKFREDWDSLKIMLDDNLKAHLEVELDEFTDIQVMEELLLKFRKAYNQSCIPYEDEMIEQEEHLLHSQDNINNNNSVFMCETGLYCPIAFYSYGVLWKGKQEFSVKYDSKVHRFCKEECLETFQKDPTKYQSYNKPFKSMPPIRICITGCIGSGKTTLSKKIAKELGLIHIDFSEIINELLIPKHFKKVGRQYENIFTDTPIDDEAVTEVETVDDKGNMESDLLSNEIEMRKTVYNYFERGSPLPSVLLKKILTKLWFQEPYSLQGFVLDDFPKLATDIEEMISCFCVPELILEIECNADITLERMLPLMFTKWTLQLEEAQNIHRTKVERAKQKWMDLITKSIIIKLTWDSLFQCIFLDFEEPMKVDSTESAVVNPDIDSDLINTNFLKVYNELLKTYPEPVDEQIWESPEDAQERIESRIQTIYEVDSENLGNMEEILTENNIAVVHINGKSSINKMFRQALFNLTHIKSKTDSFFEQTFVLSSETAEVLLLEGLYLLSKFYRMCPVYFSENPSTILSSYLISKNINQVYPVIHRSYIYFLCSKGNVQKFRKNPLKYITNEAIHLFSYFPLRIAVIGPPKSGKSTLTAKFVQNYGLLPMTRGLAIRYILHVLWWTELANKMRKVLNSGNVINYDLTMQAVQIMANDHRTMTHGIIFDGFPYNASEAKQLSDVGLYPLLVFDIHVNKDKILKNCHNEIYYNIFKTLPPYSSPLIKYKIKQWFHKKNNLRDWINEDYQNCFTVNGNESKWCCWKEANDSVAKIMPKIHNCLINISTKAVSVDNMGVSTYLSEKSLSEIRDLCPVCYTNNVIRQIGFTNNRRGLIHYKGLFYWVCDEHSDMFLKNPEMYTSFKSMELPEIPTQVFHIHDALVYENGICIVTYAENLPAQKFKAGIPKYAVSYKRKIYLFCSPECCKKFMEKPYLYWDIVTFKNKEELPQIFLNKLPHLGFLEQTLGNMLTDACCYLNILRPKYPGLSIEISGLIYIALYLKIHNPLSNTAYLPIYHKAFKTYEARCKLVKDLSLKLKSVNNPFAKYPNCCYFPASSDVGTTVKPCTLASSSFLAEI